MGDVCAHRRLLAAAAGGVFLAACALAGCSDKAKAPPQGDDFGGPTVRADAGRDAAGETDDGSADDGAPADAASETALDAPVDVSADATDSSDASDAPLDAGSSDAIDDASSEGASEAGAPDDAASEPDASTGSDASIEAAADVAAPSDAAGEPDASAPNDASDEPDVSFADASDEDVALEADEPIVDDGNVGQLPVAMQTGLGGPNSIVVDTTSVYWTDATTGSVWRAARTAGASPVKLADSAAPADNLFLDGQRLIWHSGVGASGAILSVPTQGGAGPTTLGANRTLPDHTHAISADGANLYWVDSGPTLPSASTVWALGRGAGATQRAFATGVMSPVAIAVDQLALYVAEWGDDLRGGRVYSVALGVGGSTPGALTQLVDATLGLADLAIDDTNVYFVAVTSSGTVLQRVAKSGGLPQMLWSSSGGGASFVLGASRLYWDSGGGVVAWLPIGGGQPSAIFRAVGPRSAIRSMFVSNGELWDAFGGGPDATGVSGTIEVLAL